MDGVDVPAATEKDITVTITPGAVDNAVADYTLGLIIALARRTLQSDHSLRSGLWEAFVGMDLYGKNAGYHWLWTNPARPWPVVQ